MHFLLRQHLRTLLSSVLPGFLITFLGVTLSLGPWSPLALGWADALASRGSDHAGSIYRLVAHFGLTHDLREQAAYRVAMTTAVEQGDPQQAIRALTAYARQYPEGEGSGEVLARLATLYMSHLNAPARAAKAWRKAVDADPSNPDAADWLLRAADAYEAADKDRSARELRDQVVRQYPERADEAWLASARLLLERGEIATAYEFYERVANRSDAPSLRTLAKLGMSLCLESTGNLDAALAELDDASGEGSEDVWRQRRERIRDRRVAQQKMADLREEGD